MTPSLADRPQAADHERTAMRETELASLRAQLARSEARPDALMRLSSDWSWELDAHLRFSRCSGGGDGSGDDLGRLLSGRAPWELPATTPLSGEWDDLHWLLEAGQPFVTSSA